jgi:hypothetical protein
VEKRGAPQAAGFPNWESYIAFSVVELAFYLIALHANTALLATSVG